MDIEKIIEALRKFRDDREWSQFHNSKDLALAISIEAAELLELFLWKNPEEADIQKIKEELADVFIFSMFLADKYGINVSEIINEKLASNSRKYPIDKAKGSAKKYNEL